MTPRFTTLLVLAILFILVNLAGVIYAALRSEWIHTGVHACLLLLGEYALWRLVAPRAPRY